MNPISNPFSGGLPQQQPQQPQPSQQGQPNAFEKMLPTIGGAVSGILGGIIGTPLDLLSGPVGTIAGATGGGALGGGLGKWLENSLDGQKSTVGNVGGAALEQGAGNAVGGAVGEGASLAGRGILDSLGGSTAGKFIQDKAGQYGAALLHNQLNAGMAATKLDPVALTQDLSKSGISDARQIPDLFNGVSGANGAISKGVRNVAAAAGSGGDTGVDVGGLQDMAKGLLGTDMGIGVTPADESKILNTVKQATNATAPEGSVGQQLVPGTEAFSATQALEKSAYAQFNKAYDKTGAVINPSAHAAGNVLSNIADELENRTFGNVSVTPEMKANIIDGLSPLKDKNPTFYNDIVQKVSSAQTGQDLRAAQAPIVNANKVYGAAVAAGSRNAAMGAGDLLKNAAPVAAAMTGNPLLIGGSLLPKLATSQAADRAGSSILGALGRSGTAAETPDVAAAGTGAAEKGAAKMAPVLSRIGSLLGAIGTGTATSGVANAANPNPELSNPTTASQQSTGDPAMQPQAGAPQALSPLEQFVLQQQQQQGNMAQQEALAPAMASSLAGPMASMGSTIAGLMPQVQQQQALSPVLQNLASSFQNAGGAQGPIAGAVTQATGAIPGTPANEYARSQAAASDALASMLHITPAAAAALLPQLTQGSQTAAGPSGAIGSLLASIGQ